MSFSQPVFRIEPIISDKIIKKNLYPFFKTGRKVSEKFVKNIEIVKTSQKNKIKNPYTFITPVFNKQKF